MTLPPPHHTAPPEHHQPATTSEPGPEVDAQVIKACIEVLYKNARPALLTNMAISILMATAIWLDTHNDIILYWLGANLAAAGFRFFIILQYPQPSPSPEALKRWAGLYAVATAISGAVWGYVAFAFVTHDIHALDAFVIICLMGMATGAAANLSAYLPAFFAFIVPAVASLILHLVMLGGTVNLVMAVMGTLFALMVSAMARSIHRGMCQSYEAMIRSDALSAALQASSDKRISSELRIKSILDSTGDVIIIHDQHGNIVDVNEPACENLGFTRKELLILSVADIEVAHDIETLRTHWNLDKINPKDFPLTFEGAHRNKSGNTFPVEVRVTLLPTDGETLFVAIARDMTDRLKAEEGRRISEANLANAQRIAHIGSYEWDIVTNDISWSDEHFRIYDLEPGSVEVNFDQFIKRIHPDDIEKMNNAIQQAVDTGEPMDVHFRLLMEDGTIKYVNSKGEAEYDEHGKPLRMAGIIHDITQRARAELTLRESEEHLSFLLSSSPAVIYTCETTGNYAATFISPNVRDQLGYDPTDFTSDAGFWASKIHPDDAPAVFENLGNLFKHGQHVHEYRFCLPDGSYVWVHDSLKLIYGPDGEPSEIIGAWEDVSVRKKAEEALRESEERFRDFGASASDWYWEMDKDLRFSFFSNRFTEVTNVAESMLLGKTRQESGNPGVPESDWNRHLDDLANRRPFRGFVHPRTWADGSVVWLSINGKPIFDASGKFKGYRGSGSDITALQTAKESLLRAKEEAVEANQAKSAFLSSMSHELRTPLNAILGFTQLLQLDPRTPLTEGQMDSSQQIIKSGQHLLELIDQVLELAKIESGNTTISLEPVQVNSLMNECIDLIAPLADKRNITINAKAEIFTDSFVVADRTRLKQALLNLLSNAVKYNRESGSISISATLEAGNKVHFSVADTGLGIADDKQALVFEPFNRLGHEASQIEGTGIGLTITRELLHLMGGDIGFESEPGIGSMFWIEMPVADMAASHANAEALASDAQNSNAFPVTKLSEKMSARTVLYVEDNPANLMLMERIIENQAPELELISANNAEVGIELASTGIPDIILMDINLPGMDGIEATKHLKKNQTTKHIPVIAITAAAMPAEVEKGREAEFFAYITKPIKVPELMSVIRDALAST